MTQLGCEQCGTYDKHEPCEKCGVVVHVGAWNYCPHPTDVTLHATRFEAFISKHLGGSSIMSEPEKKRANLRGVEIRTRKQHERAMKERGMFSLQDVRG